MADNPYGQFQTGNFYDAINQGYQQGTQLSQLARQQQEDQAVRQAFQRNVVPDDNGNMGLNRQGVLSDLYAKAPQKAAELDQQFANDAAAKVKAARENEMGQLDLMKKKTDTALDLIRSSTDQPSYSANVQKSIAMGLTKPGELPEQYDPKLLKNYELAHMSLKDRLDQEWKAKNFDQKEKELGIKHQEVSTRREQLALDKETKRQQQISVQDTKEAAALDNHLSKGWASRGAQAGRVQGKINDAELAEGLIQQIKAQGDGADSRQTEELAQIYSRLLGGGAQASERVSAMVPHTWWGGSQSYKEWLSNKPTGLQQQAFTERIADGIAREKAISLNQMRQYQIEGLPAHAGLKNRNPELYKSILDAKGIDPTMIDEKGRYSAPRGTSGGGGAVMSFDQWKASQGGGR